MLKDLKFLVSFVGDCFCAVRREARVGTSVLRRGRCHRARRWLHLHWVERRTKIWEIGDCANILDRLGVSRGSHDVGRCRLLLRHDPISWLSGVALSRPRRCVMAGENETVRCNVLRVARVHGYDARRIRSLFSAIYQRTLLCARVLPIAMDVRTVFVQVIGRPLVVCFGIREDLAGSSPLTVVVAMSFFIAFTAASARPLDCG